MRWALALLMGLHGLIHVIGFAKALSPASVPSLSMSVSRPMRLVWLLTAILWVAAAALVVAAPDQWWTLALPALVLSQLAIVGAWNAARMGSIANLMLVIPIGVASLLHAPWSFGTEYARGVSADTVVAVPALDQIAEADIAALPRPVQRYLRYAGAVGRPRIHNYRLQFRGGIREKASDAYMASTTEQFSRVAPASRWFLMRARRAGIPVEALHVYQGAHATFRVRVAGAVTVVRADGPEMDQSETVTLFNDICLLAPAVLVTAPVTWQTVDDQTVRAQFSNAGHTIEAELTFDENGALTNFISDDRYRSADGTTFARERWTTPVSSYRWFGNRRVAATAEARWTTANGAFTYATFELTNIAYNVSNSSGPFPS
ncbi:MAG: DUF6544 family protein [Acidobacteriota bacterium]